ncbi:FHA domain-containing protein [Microbacterium ulmi]|uniref:FHA domain-containing protein n=1 Tax=Microbacterium ulmi TaxID=179095 RepID=A0A7Y2M3E7_9MICO|nr:FHA domain-containing protein [Microbacterium ulmi]NII69711.1 hypothetical protein [Microbacterium ulmi]NNH05477.1 FHA domain-containing protein [Microbacterium ulmi]
MTEVRYASGSWRVAVTHRGVVVLEPGTAPGLAARIWRDVAAGRGLAGVLEALTGAFGASLDTIPSFAVVLEEHGSTRLAVRGALTVTVDTPTGAETVTGTGVTTWSERAFAAATRTVVDTPEESPATAELSVRDGVVLASEIVIAWTDAATSQDAPASTPAPAQRSAAAPARDAASVPSSSVTAAAPASDQPGAPASAPSPSRPWSARTASVPSEPVPVPAVAQAVPPVAPAPPVDAVIDSISVPWATSSDASNSLADAVPSVAAATPGDAPPSRPSTDAPDDDVDAGVPSGDDFPWAETVIRPFDDDDAGVRATSEDDSAGAAFGDHDGETVTVAQARAMRAALGDSAPPPLAAPRPPARGRVRLSTGKVVTLDRTVVIGRRPRSTRVTGTDLPHLVAVDSPQQDISRSHLELRVEGDSIVATDLHTTNGTTLRRAGVEPVVLHPGEAAVVVVGDVLDLGDGITATIEDLP